MKPADGAWATPRRPGMLAAVLALHVLLALVLWQALRSREVEVPVERLALLWIEPVARPSPPPAMPRPAARPAATPPRPARPPAVPAPHESTWVGPGPAVAAAPAASAASAPPAESLLDSAATRSAIRQTGRQPLLQERAAQAMGEDIARTDTGLAGGVASAGKPDCMKAPVPGGILGIPILAAMVASGKCATK